MRPSRLPHLGAVILAIVAMVAVGCGTGSAASRGALAETAPAGSELYIEGVLNPDLDAREALETISERFPRAPEFEELIAGEVDSVLRGLSADGRPLSYGRDVEPWLGPRFGAAIEQPAGAAAPTYSVVLEVSDPDAAQSGLERISAAAGDRVRAAEIDGRDVFRPVGTDLVAGLVDEELVIASTPQRFSRVAELIAGSGRSLAERPDFSYAVGTAEGASAIAFAWLDSARAVDTLAVRAGQPAMAERFDALADEAGVDLREPASFAIGITSDVALFDSSVGLLEREQPDPETDAVLLGSLPAESLAAASCSACLEILLSGRASGEIASSLAGGTPGNGQAFAVFERLRRQIDGLRRALGSASVFVYAPSPGELLGAGVLQIRDPLVVGGAIAAARRAFVELPSARVRKLRLRGMGADGFVVELGDPEPYVVAATSERLVIAYGVRAARRALSPSATLADVRAFSDFGDQLGDEFEPSALVDVARIRGLLGADPDAETRRLLRAIAPINRAGSGTRIADGRLITRFIVGFEGFDG